LADIESVFNLEEVETEIIEVLPRMRISIRLKSICVSSDGTLGTP